MAENEQAQAETAPAEAEVQEEEKSLLDQIISEGRMARDRKSVV